MGKSSNVSAPSVACEGVFPKLQFGISPSENSAYDRGCIDRNIVRKEMVCRMVTIFHFGNVSLRGWGHGGIPTRGTKHYIYVHIATFSLYIIYILIQLHEPYYWVLVTLDTHYD
jgi:hypothetical protein